MRETPEYLTVTDAGKLLDLSPSGFRKLEVKGHIDSIRTTGGIRLFKRSDVLRLRDRRAARQAS